MSTTSDGDNPDTDQPQKKLKSDSDTSFKDIILQHPNGLYTKDIKLGGTPLHWTQEKPMMEALINLGDADCHSKRATSLYKGRVQKKNWNFPDLVGGWV